MSNEPFPPGSLVRHRTGGPQMVVIRKVLEGSPAWVPVSVTTVWFDKSHNRRTASFAIEEIELVEVAAENLDGRSL